MLAILGPLTWDGVIVLTIGVVGVFPFAIKILIDLAMLKENRKDNGVKLDELKKALEESDEKLEQKFNGFDVLKDQHNQLWADRQSLWNFIRLKGDIEAEKAGYGQRHSPLQMSEGEKCDFAREVYKPIIIDLVHFYKGLTTEIRSNEASVYREIASNFSEMLNNECSTKLGVNQDSCISIAIALIKEFINGVKENPPLLKAFL